MTKIFSYFFCGMALFSFESLAFRDFGFIAGEMILAEAKLRSLVITSLFMKHA